MSKLKSILFYLTIATLLTPFLVSSRTYFPFIVAKATVFRIIVEAMLLVYLLMITRGEAKFKVNALTVFLLIYGIAVLLSAFFGVNLIWSLLSGCERMEGVIGVWHFIIFFIIITNVFDFNEFKQLFKIEIFISTFYGILSLLIYKGMAIGSVQPTPRLSGFTGNPSYLATYFIFNCFLALYFYFDSLLLEQINIIAKNSNAIKTAKHFGLRDSVRASLKTTIKSLFPQKESFLWLGIAVFDALLVFISGTRGGMIGLGIGILFLIVNLLISSRKEFLVFKKLSLIVLVIITIFLITVFSLKNTNFVKNNFALMRLTSISYKDPTGMSRLLSAETAFKSFLEKPIFGWGIENYEPAYLKNFNPEVVKVLPEDFYFDRAHNKIMEVLATTGLVGFISYLGIFIVTFILLQRKRQQEGGFIQSVVFESLIISYFVQNIFLFDFHESYLMFFLVLGFIPVLSQSEDMILKEYGFSSVALKRKDYAFQLLKGFILISAFCLIIFSLSQIVVKTYSISQGIINLARLIAAQKYDDALSEFKSLNYSIGKMDNLRKDLVIGTYNIIGSYGVINEKIEPLINELIKLSDDLLKKEPWNYRLVFNKLQLIIYESRWNKEKLEEAKQIRDDLIKIAPYFPQTYLISAKLDFLLNESEKAKLELEKVLQLDPNNNIANYLMGYYYLMQNNTTSSFDYFVKALDNGYVFNDSQLMNNLVKILAQHKDYQRIIKLYEQELKLDPKNPSVYIHLAATYAKLHNKEKAIEYAKKVVELNSQYQEAVNNFIEIVEKGEWDKIAD
ncbi:MAG: O-antigen ligase family protein [Minisyncoccia bacterium]